MKIFSLFSLFLFLIFLFQIPIYTYSITTNNCQLFSTGYTHTCAILESKELKCWGGNNYGQLGLGDSIYDIGKQSDQMGDSLSYIDFDGNNYTELVYIATSKGYSGYTCAISSDGVLKCWGYGEMGNLGNVNETVGRGTLSGEEYVSDMGDKLPSVNLGTNVYASAVQLGQYHTCVMTDENKVKC